MAPRTETYKLTDGTGRIEVRGSYSECGLFLSGEPFVFDFADCEGSVGQEVYQFTTQPDDQRFLPLSEITADYPATKSCLAELVFPLLCQFEPGTYTLTLKQLVAGEGYVENYGMPTLPYKESGYYPEDDGVCGRKWLIMTQPDEALDEDRIVHFWYEIEAGARPFAITAAVDDGRCEFVLDGHHKLTAYGYARVKPWRLCISKASLPLKEEDWPGSIVDPPRSWQRVHEFRRELSL